MINKRNIPLCIANIGEKEILAVTEVLQSGWLAHGPKGKEFEQVFSDFIGVKHSISMNSCTSALELAVQTLPKKGEIILPSFTWVASANSIITSGFKPVFVDIDYETNNINPSKIVEAITKDTVAIMPVHFAGLPCDMDKIIEIAEKYDLTIIEDSAETLGGEYKGAKTGSFGVGCFSFYPTKNITCGEGGMLTTNDEALAKKINALKAHGIKTSTYEREKINQPWLRAATYAGYNYRLCDILATIGLEQMKKLETMNSMRIKHAQYLNNNLNYSEIILPFEPDGYKHVYQMYTIKLDESIDRTVFLKNLRNDGVGASVHFDPPVHAQPYYRNTNFHLQITDKVSKSIVTLPMYPSLSNEDLDYIIFSIGNALKMSKV